MAKKDPRPTCQHTNPVIVKDGTTNLAPMPVPSSLKAIPGTKVAYDWEGHTKISSAVVDRLRQVLPPNLQWILRWIQIPSSTRNRDLIDVPTGGHWTAEGQKHHFMRAEGQTEREAYEEAVKWIFDETVTAARLLRERLNSRPRYQESRDWGFATQESEGEHLGNALHALQDSFAAGHVERDDALIISAIHVYNEENTRLGHAEKDREWKGPDGKLKPGLPAVEASVELIRYFLFLVFGPEAESIKNSLMEKYLRAKLPGATSPGGRDKAVQPSRRWYG